MGTFFDPQPNETVYCPLLVFRGIYPLSEFFLGFRDSDFAAGHMLSCFPGANKMKVVIP